MPSGLTPAGVGADVDHTVRRSCAAAIAEARDIATRLRCQPLLDRADTTQPATPHTAASRRRRQPHP